MKCEKNLVPQWINEKDVAEMTGRAVQTLRNDRCKCKGIPYSKIGTSIRYKVEDVVVFMEGRRVIPKRDGERQKLNWKSQAIDLIGGIFKIVSIVKICLDILSQNQL